MTIELRCPVCRGALRREGETLHCAGCGAAYPCSGGIADFSRGNYYDEFESEDQLAAEHRLGLAAEVAGARWRIEKFYAPKLAQSRAVLDAGCGNGVSVDVLNALGHEAWGIDLSALRKWQWLQRERRDRLAVASALELPFESGVFDAVISSGVIEHIGVAEKGGERYEVRPLPERDALRENYVRELMRVVRPGGKVFIDCPNGAFPIDFWHSTVGGSARFHARDEGFLPAFDDIRRLVKHVAPGASVRALSPHRRFAFKQVGRHWYGKLMALPMTIFFAIAGGLFASTAINPYLVVEITTPGTPPATS